MWTISDVWCLGEDQRDVWEPDAGWTPQHCQVPQVLAGHEGEPGSSKVFNLLPLFHAHKRWCMNRFFSPLSVAHRLYSSLNTCRQAASSSSWRKPRKTTRLWMWRSVFLLWSHTESHGGSSGYCSPIAIQIHFSSRIRDYVTRHCSVCSDMHLILTWWISNIHEVYSQYLPSLK